MAFGWSEGKSQKKGHFRRKIDIATVGVITMSKIEMCAIPQNKNGNLYPLLSNKKKIDRKDPETGKRQQFEIRAKSSKIVKNRPRQLGQALGGKKGDFLRFCRFLPRLRRAVVFLFLGIFCQILFLKAASKNVQFYFVESSTSQIWYS